MNPALRPLSLGELLDVSFSLYRRLFGTLFVVALITGGIPAVLNEYVSASGGPEVLPMLWLFNTVFSVVLGAVGVGASTYIVSDHYMGDRLHAGAALGRVIPYVGRIILLSILSWLAVAGGFILLIVPGVIIACGLAVAAVALVIEGLPSAVAAMKRSWELTRGHRLKVFGAMCVALLLIMIPYMALGTLAAFGGLPILFGVAFVLLAMAISPFIYVTITVLYYDLRVRKEGFDLEMLTQALRG